MDLRRCMEEYAELLVVGGINLQPGERVILNSDVSITEMAEIVTRKCYEHGAAFVDVRWSNVKMESYHYAFADMEELKKVEKWQEERLALQVEQLPAMVYLMSSEPQEYTKEMLDRKQEALLAQLPIVMKYKDQMQDKYKWTIIGVPTQAWADQVFPGEENNLMHLWEDVLATVMVNGDGTAVEKWAKKWNAAWDHMDALNALEFCSLHMKTGLGTDLKVELHPDGEFHAAAYRHAGYAANIPSEELYTSPLAGKAEGKMVASCPLVYQDQFIDGIELTFENGRVSEVKATQNEEFLKQLVATDEGAGMLGEVAIVDKESPIGKLGHLMYHTLYDENAACHVAIGRGFPFVLKNFANMTDEERLNCGLNKSGVHCDIMFGTDDTEITGITKDGREICIMKDGLWQI